MLNRNFEVPEIDKGIPLPEEGRLRRRDSQPRNKRSPRKEFLESLAVGDSFQIPYHSVGAYMFMAKKYNIPITYIRTVHKKRDDIRLWPLMARVWRIESWD